ncbi:MAG: hypothetical protein AAFV37_11115, partial [Pseudomonadota bacterium]
MFDTLMDHLSQDLELLLNIECETDRIDPIELQGLVLSSLELFGSETAFGTELARKLLIEPELINTFMDGSSLVSVRDAKVLVSKLLSYLASVEELCTGKDDKLCATPSLQTADKEVNCEKVVCPSNKALIVPASVWIERSNSNIEKGDIAATSVFLQTVVTLIKAPKRPAHKCALGSSERAQLLSLLETTILMLKAPLVEKGLLTNLEIALRGLVSHISSEES